MMATMIQPLGLVVTLILTTQVCSFVGRAPYCHPTNTKSVPLVLFAVADDDAIQQENDHMWEHLKYQERDMVVQSVLQDKDLDIVTKTLVEKLLEAALEHVKTQEHLEQEHVESARQAFDHALEEEHSLEELVEEDKLKDVPMDSYLEGRLHAAQLEEEQAMKDDQKAIDKFDEWKQSEEDIRAALEALKILNKKQEE